MPAWKPLSPPDTREWTGKLFITAEHNNCAKNNTGLFHKSARMGILEESPSAEAVGQGSPRHKV